MAVKVGINGFGRVGRLAARILGLGHSDLELVAVNARADNFQLAHLLKYDSVHRTYAGNVEHDDQGLIIEGRQVAVTRQPTPAEIPWKKLGVQIVLETSGKFKDREKAQGHIKAGARKVLVGAPGKDLDVMLVLGVNDQLYDPAKHHLISNASCTTNCLAPVVKCLHSAFGVEYGLMTTIHAYTMSQRILDGSQKDIRRARAAAMSMIPTSTGAARAVTQVIPELEGKLDGFSIRVPTPDVSLVDLACVLGRKASKEQINAALKKEAQGSMKGIMEVTEEPLVSVDYTSCAYSAVVDAPLTQVMNGSLAKVIAWYDNEMGYTSRLVDLAALVAKKL